MRVVLSLREDYLPHLTDMKRRIASIGRVLFRVLHLNGNQAREVLTMPGGFGEPGAVEGILRGFYPGGVGNENVWVPDEELEVEPSLLSLLCERLVRREGRPGVRHEGLRKELLKIFFRFFLLLRPGYDFRYAFGFIRRLFRRRIPEKY